MSGSNFTEGVEDTPSAAPGEKNPVLLGLSIAKELLKYQLILLDIFQDDLVSSNPQPKMLEI